MKARTALIFGLLLFTGTKAYSQSAMVIYIYASPYWTNPQTGKPVDNGTHVSEIDSMIGVLNSGGSMDYGTQVVTVNTFSDANSAIATAIANGQYAYVIVEGDKDTHDIVDMSDSASSQSVISGATHIFSCANGVTDCNQIGFELKTMNGGTYHAITLPDMLKYKHKHKFRVIIGKIH